MKRTTMVLGGLLTLSLVANGFADTTNVYSKNAVGYVNYSLLSGYTLLSVQLEKSSDTPLTINDAFSTNMPEGTSLYVFKPPSGPYDIYIYLPTAFGGWVDGYFTRFNEGTNTLPRNCGFWVDLPSATNVSLVGQVPATTTSVAIAAGYTILAYPYPVATLLSKTQIGQKGQDGDSIYIWNGVDYDIYNYITALGGWVNGSFVPADPLLNTGFGFWYSNSGSARNIDEPKPYMFP